MTQTLEAMRRRIDTAEDLYSVVRVMKALAAASVRQYETAVESLAEYNRTIEAGLQVVIQSRPEALSSPPHTARRMLVVFGSDQGMCGSFNEQIAAFALDQLGEEDRDVLVIGSRVVGRLEDAGLTITGRFSMPSSVAGITPVVNAVLLAVEELRARHGYDEFVLVHHRPVAPAGHAPTHLKLLPLDDAWLEDLASRDWDSRTLPTFSMHWQALFSSLIRQHLFVALYRAFAESLASENASRLSSMHAAERNIQTHLERLALDYHQGRQQAITEELLDIVAGFESLQPKRKERFA